MYSAFCNNGSQVFVTEFTKRALFTIGINTNTCNQ